MTAGETDCCGVGGSLGMTAGSTDCWGAGGSSGLTACGILGLLTQALGILLGEEEALLAARARSFPLIYSLLTGQVSELVIWSLFLQLLQKGLLRQSVAECPGLRHLEQSLGPSHVLLQFLDLQVKHISLAMLWCMCLDDAKIVP